MKDRYSRAAQLTGPKVAAVTPDATVEGYLLDETHFFNVEEQSELASRAIVAVPRILNCASGCSEPVVSLAVLSELIASHSGRECGLAGLGSAQFDMPNRDTLAISLNGV